MEESVALVKQNLSATNPQSPMHLKCKMQYFSKTFVFCQKEHQQKHWVAKGIINNDSNNINNSNNIAAKNISYKYLF